VYLGPNLYKILQLQEGLFIRNFTKWKITARLSLWTWLHNAIKEKQNELESKIPQRSQTNFINFFSCHSPHNIRDESSRHQFPRILINKILSQWTQNIHTEYEKDQIDVLIMQLVHTGHEEEKIKKVISIPLKNHFNNYLIELLQEYYQSDCVKKFINLGNLNDFAKDVEKIKNDCRAHLSPYDAKDDDNELKSTLLKAIKNYKDTAIAWIQEDIKATNCLPLYNNLSAEEFVEKILTSLNLNDKLEEVIPLRLTNIRNLKHGKSLIEIATTKFISIEDISLKRNFFNIIALLYEYGAHDDLAFGSKNEPRLRTNPIQDTQLEWKLISSQLSAIPVYNEFEETIKKILIEYSTEILKLYGAEWYYKAYYDWHNLRCSPNRLYDVQELAFALLNSSLSFDDSKLYTVFTSLQERKDPKLRIHHSRLYQTINEEVIQPTFEKIFSFFGEIESDPVRGMKIIPCKYIKLRSNISALREENESLLKTLQNQIEENDKLREQLELKNTKKPKYNLGGQVKVSSPPIYVIPESRLNEELPTSIPPSSRHSAPLGEETKRLPNRHNETNQETLNTLDYSRVLPRDDSESSNEEETQAGINHSKTPHFFNQNETSPSDKSSRPPVNIPNSNSLP
jgi:hypothetical protein